MIETGACLLDFVFCAETGISFGRPIRILFLRRIIARRFFFRVRIVAADSVLRLIMRSGCFSGGGTDTEAKGSLLIEVRPSGSLIWGKNGIAAPGVTDESK
jgi:hypothetical protein